MPNGRSGRGGGALPATEADEWDERLDECRAGLGSVGAWARAIKRGRTALSAHRVELTSPARVTLPASRRCDQVRGPHDPKRCTTGLASSTHGGQ